MLSLWFFLSPSKKTRKIIGRLLGNFNITLPVFLILNIIFSSLIRNGTNGFL